MKRGNAPVKRTNQSEGDSKKILSGKEVTHGMQLIFSKMRKDAEEQHTDNKEK